MSAPVDTIAIENQTRQTYRQAVSAWVDRDLEATLSFISDDVVHVLQTDAACGPAAALSTTGKAGLRDRLEAILDAFYCAAMVTDVLKVDGTKARASLKIIYIHVATGERLVTKLRLYVEVRDGLIRHMEEYHDAAYLEAFLRLVRQQS